MNHGAIYILKYKKRLLNLETFELKSVKAKDRYHIHYDPKNP